ncbi:hypothetical protein HBI52_096050 [Parastagonospora nodorum]|nr:hypothetical protein HBI52_096050 [Parastagonospora nodorum]
MDWHVHREQTCSNIKSQLPIPGAEPDTQTDGQSDQHDHGDPHNRGRLVQLIIEAPGACISRAVLVRDVCKSSQEKFDLRRRYADTTNELREHHVRADLVDVFVRNNPALNVSDLDCSQPLIDSYGAFYQYPKYLDFADYQAMHDHHLPDLF